MGFSLLLEEQNKDVGQKLGIATIAMVTLPLMTYFIGYYYLFAHKADPTSWSGAAAIVVVNCVIAGYVIMAFSEPDDDDDKRGGHQKYMEDDDDPQNNNDADGDAKYPRTGVFKQRVD